MAIAYGRSNRRYKMSNTWEQSIYDYIQQLMKEKTGWEGQLARKSADALLAAQANQAHEQSQLTKALAATEAMKTTPQQVGPISGSADSIIGGSKTAYPWMPMGRGSGGGGGGGKIGLPPLSSEEEAAKKARALAEKEHWESMSSNLAPYGYTYGPNNPNSPGYSYAGDSYSPPSYDYPSSSYIPQGSGNSDPWTVPPEMEGW
jgi:hypothetical protein